MDNYVVIARFDDKTNNNLYELQNSLINLGYEESISEWPPHITIAAYENIPLDELCKWTENFANIQYIFPITLSSLGIFPPNDDNIDTALVYVAPASSHSLIKFYYDFHKKLDNYCGNLGWLYSAKYGFPVIHSTIGIFDMRNIQKATEIIFEHETFVEAKIIALEIYTYPMKLIKRYNLKHSA